MVQKQIEEMNAKHNLTPKPVKIEIAYLKYYIKTL